MSGSCANNAPSCGFEELAQKLEGAVLHTMNPSVDNSARHQAYQMLEQAKEDPSVSIPCGFLLSVNTRPSIVRHVGLHLLEINIKYKWNQLSMEDKESIKVNTMALLSSHQNAGPEESFIQDKISRLVVELAKHTWPQLWPSFMEELHECALLGPKQTETVLLVITRLSEDVAVLQTVECSKRRRELYQCLAGGMSETFEWLLRLLGQHYNPGSHVNLSLLKGVLQCLTSLVEWVAVQHLFSDSAKLLHMLCCLLNDDNLKLHAAQCLLAVVSRKGGAEERLPLLSLFHSDCVGAIYESARRALQADNATTHYEFIKTLALIVMQLALQLCQLSSKLDGVQLPDNFQHYLTVLHEFGQHPSVMVYGSFILAWSALLSHASISSSPLMAACIASWLPTVPGKLLLSGFPSADDSPACLYSRADFDDSDERFVEVFHKVRRDLSAAFRTAACQQPSLTWRLVEEKCDEMLRLPQPDVPASSGAGTDTRQNPWLLYQRQWEVLCFLVEWIMRSQPRDVEHGAEAVACGLRMLASFLEFSSDDDKVMFSLLSCISNLFPFIVHQPATLTPVFNKIVNPLLVYSRCSDPKTLQKSTKELRRHCGLLVARLAKLYPTIMLPGLSCVVDIFKELNSSANRLTVLELTALQEALILINNARNNYAEQQAFIETQIQPIRDFFEQSKQHFTAPLEFMKFVGIANETETPEEEAVIISNRYRLTYALKILEAIAKKSRPPQDKSVRAAGGFIVEISDGASIKEVTRNPCWQAAVSLLHDVMSLTRVSNSLCLPESIAALPPVLTSAHQLPISDKLTILMLKQKPLSEEDQQAAEGRTRRAQAYLHLLHETLLSCLAELCRCCHPDVFYRTDNLLQYTLQAPLYCMEVMPHYRLRGVLRMLLSPWLVNCPPSAQRSFVLPVLQLVTNNMNKFFERRWQSVDGSRQLPAVDDEALDEDEPQDGALRSGLLSQELEELLDVQLLRLLNRDYLDFLRAVLVQAPRNKLSEADDAEADVGEAADYTDGCMNEVSVKCGDNSAEDITDKAASAPASGRLVSALGSMILSSAVMPPVISALLQSLSCPDSQCCLKACGLLTVCLPTMDVSQLTDDDSCGLLRAMLTGLQVHGQHAENLQAMLACVLLCYTTLRPHCAVLPQVLTSISTDSGAEVASFDELVVRGLSEVKNAKQDKIRKDSLKKILTPITGVSVSEALKQPAAVPCLPPLLWHRPPQQQHDALDAPDGHLVLGNLFS